jgi:signal transduction histidine kinase
MLLKLSYDGNGLSQEDYIRLSQTGAGLGLKNIQSRLKVVHGDIWFEFVPSTSSYNITIDIPKDIEER